jgi:hypothetical protein
MERQPAFVDVLSHLHDYYSSHESASKSLKSSIWNISKARRLKGGLGIGFSYTATNVRDNLRAHAFVTCNKEPGLASEEENDDENEDRLKGLNDNNDDDDDDGQEEPLTFIQEKNDVNQSFDYFKLRFGNISYHNSQSGRINSTDPVSTLSSATPCTTGLRRRKGKDSNQDPKVDQWSEEIPQEDEEKKRNDVTPIGEYLNSFLVIRFYSYRKKS